MSRATAVVVVLLVACGAEKATLGHKDTNSFVDLNPHPGLPSDEAASAAEALTILDLGPVDNVGTKKAIELSVREGADGSAESAVGFLANAGGYVVSITLGDVLNRKEWAIGSDELDVIASVSFESSDGELVRMQSGTATTEIGADTATITIVAGMALEMEGDLSGTVSGKLERTCHNRVPARPDAEGNPPTLETMIQLDPEWDSEFCQAQK